MKALDRFLEVISLYEPHGVEGPAISVLAEAVNWHNPGVFQAASHFRFKNEPRPALRVVRMSFLNLLERYITWQFFVAGEEYLSQRSLVM
jgi:hypothetical protein